jgi:hypothetical protein
MRLATLHDFADEQAEFYWLYMHWVYSHYQIRCFNGCGKWVQLVLWV